jgi:CubicO group peptidase (beta-lactamase class C family)
VNDLKLAEAVAELERATKPPNPSVSTAALLVRRSGATLVHEGFGGAPDTVFLLASISKPMTAAGAMLLVDRGELCLSDPVGRFIPEFAGGDRDRVTVRHLLTHTSGLPDMLPENVELRKRHAPLEDFVAATCKTPLLFQPGAEVRYQSMGILLASEVVQRITHQPFREFLRREVFEPVGMTRTSLGLGGRKIANTARCQVAGDEDWNWNSPYWRDLGAPWGGAHSDTADVARFVEVFLEPRGGILRPQTAAAMVVDQNPGLNEPRGLAWMVKPGTFGRACSPRSFGHYGMTGTVAWADPETRLVCVLLTTQPAAHSRDGLLGRISDLVAEL